LQKEIGRVFFKKENPNNRPIRPERKRACTISPVAFPCEKGRKGDTLTGCGISGGAIEDILKEMP
jgi:hypothetical protein